MQANAAAGRAGGAWRVTLAAMCALLVGTGLARFAYTPLLPALVTAGWFSASAAAYLGAANLAGYLVGALTAPRVATRVGARLMLRTMMMLATASFFASVVPVSFTWFFLWRFAAGWAGAALMVLAAVCTGVLMLKKIVTPFFSRDPYLLSMNTWGIVYVIHGLAALAAVTLVIIHVYFALLPENRRYLRAMVHGSMTRP